MNAILIDDEKKSITNLQLLLTEHCKEINIIGTAHNALEAVKLILENKPDIVFLDIQMPGYNGFDVVEQIKGSSSKIIFTTAHKDYAIEALRKGAVDYLLKPIDSEELVNCIARLKENATKKMPESKEKNQLKLIELNVKDGIIFIKPMDIIRLEASGSYTTFFLKNSIKHIVSRGLKDYEHLLNNTFFYRCHKSHIINLKEVNKFINHDGLYALMTDLSQIEIARVNKEEFLERLKNLNE